MNSWGLKIKQLREDRHYTQDELAQIVVTEQEIDNVLASVSKVLDITEPQALRVALKRFIGRLEVDGRKIDFQYTFSFPKDEGNFKSQWRPERVGGDIEKSITFVMPPRLFARKTKITPARSILGETV